MKTSFKVLTVISAMAVLSGCPDKGGGQSAPAAVTISGISGNGECTQTAANTYEFIRNSSNYTDLQQVKNACSSLVSLIGTQTCRITNMNAIVSMADVQYKCNMANGVGGNINNPYPNQPGYPGQSGYPNQPIQNVPNVPMKNLVCSIDVASGAAAGSVSNMPVQVFANGADLNLYADMQNTKSYLGGFVNFTRYFRSEKLALLKLKFKAGNSLNADTLTLSADLRNGKTASVTGFAGSEVRIEITPDSEQDTSLVVSCSGQDNFNVGPAINGANLRCSVKENDNGKVTNVIVLKPVVEFETGGVNPIKGSNLILESNSQNTLSTTVLPSTAFESYKLISGLTTPSTVKIKSSGYSLESNCVRQ